MDASSGGDLILKSDNEDGVLNEATTRELKGTSSDKGAVVELSEANSDHVDLNSSTSSVRRKDGNAPSENRSKGDTGKWVVENGDAVSFDGDGRELDGVVDGEFYSRWRSRETGRVWQHWERVEVDGFQRMVKNESDGVRILTSNFVDEGPSNYGDFRDGASRVQYFEADRAGLLRKLDEIKEQLSRSFVVGDTSKPRDRVTPNEKVVPSNHYGGSDLRFHGGSALPQEASMHLFGHDKNHFGARFQSHRPEPLPGNARREMGMHSSMQEPSHVHGCRYPPRKYLSRHYFDAANHDLFEPYPSNATSHKPPCSCFYCYENQRVAFGYHVRSSGTDVPAPAFYASKSHTRWPGDLTPEMGGFAYGRPRKVVIGSVAGVAPFLTCPNCFQLLQLPKKALSKAKTQQKLKCGGCYTVIICAAVKNKPVISVNKEAVDNPTQVNRSPTVTIDTSNSRGHINHDFSSGELNHSGYDFQALDPDPIASSTKHQETHGLNASSPTTSVDEDSLVILPAPGEARNLLEKPIKPTVSPPPPGSPLQQHFDYSSSNYASNQFGKGNKSSRSDQEKVVMTNHKVVTRKNPMEEESLATEVELQPHEYSNNGVSQDSGYDSKEENQQKGKESFIGNFIKKNFKDLSKSEIDEHGESSVFINGHLIPDHLVKKTEKQAGKILPGQYWYDFRAGFWGVMGGPCLGIIPPCIEEFNHPMPVNCAAGNTTVFVNGRELHCKDLDLLSTRGLPTERNRYYTIEISGRVVDQDTGEVLNSLGKLAPTVQKMKRGFGMRLPKAA